MIGAEGRMKNVLGAAVTSSVVFFLITNFGSWIDGHGLYPMNFAGLMECYAAGLLFYKNELFGSFFFNSVMGNVFFSTVAFGLYNYYQKVFTPSVA